MELQNSVLMSWRGGGTGRRTGLASLPFFDQFVEHCSQRIEQLIALGFLRIGEKLSRLGAAAAASVFCIFAQQQQLGGGCGLGIAQHLPGSSAASAILETATPKAAAIENDVFIALG